MGAEIKSENLLSCVSAAAHAFRRLCLPLAVELGSAGKNVQWFSLNMNTYQGPVDFFKPKTVVLRWYQNVPGKGNVYTLWYRFLEVLGYNCIIPKANSSNISYLEILARYFQLRTTLFQDHWTGLAQPIERETILESEYKSDKSIFLKLYFKCPLFFNGARGNTELLPD